MPAERDIGLAVIDELWTVPTNQPWQTDFRFWMGRGRGTPAVITAAAGSLKADGASAVALALSTGSGGGLTIDGQYVRLDKAVSAVPIGVYVLEVRVTLDTGATKQLRVPVQLIEGDS